MQAIKIAGFLPTLFMSQFFVSIPVPEYDFSGQTVIVTGSNTGLGKQAARHLVRLKASKVILAVRTISKGEAAARDIEESCEASPTVVEVWELDAGEEASIDAFVKRVQSLDRLDAAILNAGMMTQKWSTINNHESTIAVNVFGSFRLARLLLPKMEHSAQRTGHRGRLTVVGSDMMYVANLSELETDGKIIDKLDNKAESAEWMGQRYQMSKILIFWAMRELASLNPLTSGAGVILTVMTPGACKSELFRDDISPKLKAMATSMLYSSIARSSREQCSSAVTAFTIVSPKYDFSKISFSGISGCSRCCTPQMPCDTSSFHGGNCFGRERKYGHLAARVRSTVRLQASWNVCTSSGENA